MTAIGSTASFEVKKGRIAAQFAGSAAPIALSKRTSNLFRQREQRDVRRLDLNDFCSVIDIDSERNLVNVEGLMTYHELANATLRAGYMPAVVPELKTITIGGALTGGGIESSSFRHGFVHETVEEIEILIGDGSTLIATRDNEHRDLFFGFPNSYGTLGYALRLKARIVPVKPYVAIEHRLFKEAHALFDAMADACASSVDFVDATVFSPGEHVLTCGRFADEAPYTHDYTYLGIYYRSLQMRETDYLTVYNYLWRWDPDWFWCSKRFGLQHRIPRILFGKLCLRSAFYWKLMHLNQRFGIMRRLGRQKQTESVIQDVQIPLANAEAFLKFFHNRIGIQPVWLCPSQSPRKDSRFALYSTDPDTLYVNFGFWDVIPTQNPDGYYNRLIENKVVELGGKKSLYSASYFDEAEFYELYNGAEYDALKRRYDPDAAFKGLYEKCVQRT